MKNCMYIIIFCPSDTLTEPNYPSVATPCLVSAVCRLLTNLITLSPDDTIQTLQSYNVIETLIR